VRVRGGVSSRERPRASGSLMRKGYVGGACWDHAVT
jgi:hypothetical protein